MKDSILMAMGNLALLEYLRTMEMEQVQKLKSGEIQEAEILELAIRDAGIEMLKRVRDSRFTILS
jgi:hypothetical protein